MGVRRIVAIFLVICLIAALLYESEAYLSPASQASNRRRRRRITQYNRPDDQYTDQLVADNMENERKTELENDLEIDEMETKLDDQKRHQKRDSYYYDEEI
ncbi:hypothetical protein OS493_035845 [Desmophyllum pertusum]|uniref:Uncharacterized protein n=1 Tax=Desmophyllum pertusum TaxID=174260 RepID=A0A9W9ZWG2_9CNID|nr:hypothetical protein OS493_035845 [Desmophyllum pertusum]